MLGVPATDSVNSFQSTRARARQDGVMTKPFRATLTDLHLVLCAIRRALWAAPTAGEGQDGAEALAHLGSLVDDLEELLTPPISFERADVRAVLEEVDALFACRTPDETFRSFYAHMLARSEALRALDDELWRVRRASAIVGAAPEGES